MVYPPEFEVFFQEVLPLWDGKTSVFLPAEVLVKRIFKKE